MITLLNIKEFVQNININKIIDYSLIKNLNN